MGSASPVRIDEALRRVAEIHAHMARGAMFRGYRAVPVALTGAAAFSVAAAETWWFPSRDARAHALLWLVVAALCAAAIAADIALRRAVQPSSETRQVLGQLVPPLAVGLLFGAVFRDQAELLPGLWSVCLGLGALASVPYLPRATRWVGAWYLVAGAALLFTTPPGGVPSPWGMGLVFGCGQLASALVLRLGLEEGAR